MSQLIIFDWDWTLAIPASGETFRKPGERYTWIYDLERPHSSRKELLEHLYYNGAQIAIATNQGGIAFGIIGLEDTKDKIFSLLKDLDFPVPFLICPYHEQRPNDYRAYANWRKPLPGMLLRLWHLFPDVDASDVLVVGDRDEDEQAAKGAAFDFRHADAFFAEVEKDLEAFIAAEQNADEAFDDDPANIPF